MENSSKTEKMNITFEEHEGGNTFFLHQNWFKVTEKDFEAEITTSIQNTAIVIEGTYKGVKFRRIVYATDLVSQWTSKITSDIDAKIDLNQIKNS